MSPYSVLTQTQQSSTLLYMKIKIELTVAVDPDEWSETYGLGWGPSPAEIRDDVKRWACNAICHHPDGLVELMREGR